MGGGPRIFPGGLNKWQWKRMHEKKAREKENKLLDQEKQLYEARIRTEIRAKMWGNSDSGEKTKKSSQSHGPMSPKEHIKTLADRFMKAGAEDLWNENDGPVKESDDGWGLSRRDNGRSGSNSIDSSSNSSIDVRKLVSGRRGFSSMRRGRFKRNESSCDEGDDFDAKKLDTLSPFSPKFAGTKEKVKSSKSVVGVIRNKGLFGRRKFRKNDSSTEEDSEEEGEEGKMNGWMDLRKTGSSAALGNHDIKLTKRVNRNVTDEGLYPPLDINTVREDLSKRKSVDNVMEENREPHDSIFSGKRFDESSISPLTLKALSVSGIVKMTRVQDATLSECLDDNAVRLKKQLPAIETVLKAMNSGNGVHKVAPIFALILCPTRELASQRSVYRVTENSIYIGLLKDLPLEPIPVPDLDSRVKLQVDQSMAKIDTSIKEAAYHAWLGYYNSVRETGRDKTTLAELANRFCHSIGLEKPPALFRRTAVKMGLKGISGIPIQK
ncbi:unnamed protein product [Arabidopsis lyrata]|nr:unnamed protein product [Arabidopsis lyrata]